MENEQGKMVYEADVVISGKEYKVEMDSEGKILEKKIKNDEDEYEDNN